MKTRLRVALLLLVPAACSPRPAPSPQARADAARLSACRQRADEVYAQQNRRAIYLSDDQRDTPYSANYVSGVTSRGLADQYVRDNQIDDCVREGDAAQDPLATSTIARPTGARP